MIILDAVLLVFLEAGALGGELVAARLNGIELEGAAGLGSSRSSVWPVSCPTSDLTCLPQPAGHTSDVAARVWRGFSHDFIVIRRLVAPFRWLVGRQRADFACWMLVGGGLSMVSMLMILGLGVNVDRASFWFLVLALLFFGLSNGK